MGSGHQRDEMKMTRFLQILLFVLIATSGCRRVEEPVVVTLDKLTIVQRAPLHASEIHMERRTASGQSSVTMTLAASHSSRTNIQETAAGTVTTANWETVETTMTFSLGEGRNCEMSPRFLEHKAGYDVWKMDLKYTTTTDHEGAKVSETSQRSTPVAFDGTNAVIICEDERHTISMRPAISCARKKE